MSSKLYLPLEQHNMARATLWPGLRGYVLMGVLLLAVASTMAQEAAPAADANTAAAAQDEENATGVPKGVNCGDGLIRNSMLPVSISNQPLLFIHII